MPNWHGLTRYRHLVTGGNGYGNRTLSGHTGYQFVTSCYRLPVTLNGLSVKAFKKLLPMLPENNIYIAHSSQKGIQWG